MNPWIKRRRAGVLLHITSLPGPQTCGVLGEEARWFVDALCDGGFSVWQFLPLGPTHGHGSPYESLSSFAGNPDFIDLRECASRGWIDASDLHAVHDAPGANTARTKAAIGFWNETKVNIDLAESVRHFQIENIAWLDDFSLFMALKKAYDGQPWWQWPKPIRQRDPEAMAGAKHLHTGGIHQIIFEQYLFSRQWDALKTYAETRGIILFGDLPIYAAHDSADVWTNRTLFTINEDGLCSEVAGVPPDYFSTTGQRWGNPLYRWEQLEASHFDWWVKRIQAQLVRMHILRIDHFRGLEAYWAIPGECKDGTVGEWRKGPGAALLEAVNTALGRLPLVAEDLGLITPEVTALLEQYGLPGMKVLQFAFDGMPDNPYLPENFGPNSVIYTCTHDNDTTLGWFRALSPEETERLASYADLSGSDMPWPLIRLSIESQARLAIIPMQDLLSLGSEARFNTPGTTKDNWQWRMQHGQVTDEIWARAYELNLRSGRVIEPA
ncbi:MAG: 4-alpha-glucanotransferase [Mariprofundaceae bacterium]|nr:4-alpha-glucanotransferase [Mariprofundaceae bacterium]